MRGASFLRLCVCVCVRVRACGCACANLSCMHIFVLLACTWVMLTAGLKGAGCQVMRSLRGNYKARGSGQPQDPRMALDPELEMEAFNSDTRKWFLSTLQASLEADSVPVKPPREGTPCSAHCLQPSETRGRGPRQAVRRLLTQRNCDTINVHLLKPLNLCWFVTQQEKRSTL